MHNRESLVVFSHLRWNFVYQRPQHLLSRLANFRPVFFIEEPIHDPSSAPHIETYQPCPNVTVLQPHTHCAAPGYCQDQLPEVKRQLETYFQSNPIGPHVLWFYTPLALPLADLFEPHAVIYDCMDELSGFLFAPAELRERELQLFQFADLVFTGGPSLYRSKQKQHANVHCFPSSVDVAHFDGRRAVDEAPDQAHIARPRFGYYGVIDERIDTELIGYLAAQRPDWQFVMVGPVVKIDQDRLPRRDNIHYLGQKAYSELPSYLRGWDVCLQPFAINAATKFISPTKTLEYMAAGHLIVSTNITDVAEPYGHIVFMANNHDEFVAACDRALACGPEERKQRLAESVRVLGRTSWERTVLEMEDLIAETVKQRGASAPAVHRKEQHPVVVAGAGPTGLSAAYHLGEQAILVERNATVGGWCRSVEDHGFTFDYAGHIMFSADPYVHQMYQMLLGDNVHWQDREAWIYSKNTFTRYPFQGSLYGLPADVIRECIVGAIEARFGSLKTAKNGSGEGNGAPKTNGAPACSKDASLTDCCADGILESSAKLALASGAAHEHTEPRNFEEFIYKVWGAGIAKHFAIPYNRKLWAVPLTEMETSWLGGRVPMPDLGEMIEGALKPAPKPMGPNARFGYPLRGGFQALMNGFLPHLKGELLLETSVEEVNPLKHTVRLSNGRQIRYGHLISTMPLPALVRAMGSAAPRPVREAVKLLEHVSVRCVNLGLGCERPTDKHWIYYPEDTVFHRIFVQGNASPYCNPPGGFGITCEITYSRHKPLPCDGDDLIRMCIEDCRRVGMIPEGVEVVAANQVDMPYAYVVYNHARKQAVETIRKWLEDHQILLAGRYSEWEYYNSDHAFTAGRKAAEQVRQAQTSVPAESPVLSASKSESVSTRRVQ